MVSVDRDIYRSIVNEGAEYDFDYGYNYENASKGRNYGIDITINKNFSDGYYIMLAGSLFKSEYRDGAGIWRSTMFDLEHVVNILGGIEWNLDQNKEYVLSADFKISHIGGNKVVPLDLAQCAATSRNKVIEIGWDDQMQKIENQYQFGLLGIWDTALIFRLLAHHKYSCYLRVYAG